MISLFKNRKIREKLSVGFGIILLFLVILGVFVFRDSAKIRGQVRRVETRYFTAINLSSSLNIELSRLQSTLAHYVLDKSDRYLERARIHIDKFSIMLDEFRDLVRDEPDKFFELADLAKKFGDYNKAANELMRIVEAAGGRQEIIGQLIELKRLEEMAERKVDDIQNEDYVSLSESLAMVDNLSRLLQAAVIVLSLLMVLLGIWIFTALTGNIDLQVARLMEGTGRIVKKDFDYQIPAGDSKDELGSLISSFNWMTRQLRDTTVSKSELEKAVSTLEKESAACREAQEELRRNYLVQSSLNSFLKLSLKDAEVDFILDAALGLLVSLPIFRFESKGAIFFTEGQSLVMKVQKNLSPYLLKECANLPFGKCLCGKAAATKKIQFVNALDESHEVRFDGIKPHGHYCVPIMFGEELLGVLNMYIAAQEPHDPRAEEFLKAVTNILANVIVRNRAQEDLKKSEANLSTAQHLAKIGSWEWNSRAGKFFWSKEACSLFDRRPEDMPKSITELDKAVAEGDREKPTDFFRKVVSEQKKFFGFEFRITAREGRERFLRIEGSFIKKVDTAGGFELAGTLRDMTFQKAIEKSQRLVQLGILVARVAHEVNNPLMVVSGYAQLALMEDLKNEELKRDLEVIVKECDRAKYIIHRLLSFSKPSKGEEEEADVNAVIDEITSLLEHQYSLENVAIVKNYGKGLPRLKTDIKGFQEVISNLLNNAQDAIEDKGTIEITTSFAEGALKIEVKDTGVGMSEDVLNKVFDPFFSTKPMGTGLGLSVSYNIIKTLGGELSFQSAPGKGTTAAVIMPVRSF